MSVVVVTRNRLKALETSLPLLTVQTRRPKEVIVVDSSEHPEPSRRLAERLEATSGIPFRFIEAPRGMTLQRNIGLRHVSGDVVVFPDDDSLFFPDALEEFAKVYTADTDGKVVGVQLSESTANPLDGVGSATGNARPYEGRRRSRIAAAAGKVYYRWIEPKIAPPPMRRLGQSLIEGTSLPANLAALGCRLSADQTGFRMSFRTWAVRSRPFNETLTEYAYGEDRDVCYGLRDLGIIVTSPAARVHHHQHASGRQSGFRHGVVEVLNTAYIVCRHSDPSNEARQALRPWITLRTAVAAAQVRSGYNRDRIRGLLAARKELPKILRAAPSELDRAYSSAMARLLPSEGRGPAGLPRADGRARVRLGP